MSTIHCQHTSFSKTQKRGLTTLLAVLLLSVTAWAQNTLTVADFTAAAGKEAAVPIFLTNSKEVVGIQFDITLPYERSSTDVSLIANRSNGHSVTLRKLSNLKYSVVVMSMQNNALRGNAGQVLRFPIKVSSDAQADEKKPVVLSNIVLTDRQGHNIAAALTSEATFTVLRTPSPDFVVSDLRILGGNGNSLVPGGKLQVSFNVKNQGTGESKSGWTEKVYLEDASGYRVYVGTRSYGNTVAADDVVPRVYEIDLPKVMKTEGTVRAVVELTPQQDSGELIADQGNNSATSANSIQLEKRLFLSESRILLQEGGRQYVTLTRSGDWSMDETFTIRESGSSQGNLLQLPSSVTIPAKQSAVQFQVQSVDNTDVNDQFRTGITASGNDYPEVSMIVDVEDNDNWPLTIATDKKTYDEGDELTLTVSISKARESDLKIDISNTATSRLYPYVRSITIPAGQLSASATTQVVDDGYPMVDAIVTFTASASGFETARCSATMRDNDWPILSIKVTPSSISEGGGYGAAMATITRTGNTSENVTVLVTSSSSFLYFDSNKNIIPAGQSSVSIPVSVMDNATIDGNRTTTITAAVCDAQTGTAVGQGSASFCTATVTVTDDDNNQTLKLQCNSATLAEGGGSALVTITRNTTSGNCVVNLSSDDTQLEMPATVTIANGQSSATFTVRAKANTTEGDEHYSSITATANGYATSSFTFLISDRSLPQAVCDAPSVVTSAYGGQTVSASINIGNEGNATLPAGMELTFYLSTDQSIRYDNYYKSPMQEVATVTTTKSVAMGANATMNYQLILPDNLKEQQYYLFVWLNKNQKTEEINGVHNPSATAPIYVRAPFTPLTLTTDRDSYSRGDVMEINGQMSNAKSKLSMEGKTVDIYLIDTEGTREVHTATMDAEGRFTLNYTIGNLAGRYGVGACSQNAGSTEALAHVNVTALKIEPRYLKLTLTEGMATEGNIQVTNLSANSMSDLRFSLSGLPRKWNVTLSGNVSTLAAGATTNVAYRIVPSSASASQQFAEGSFNVSAKDNGTDVEAQMPVYFYAYAAQCQLATSAGNGIKTTISKETRRNLTLTVQNTGLIATGNIVVECPSSQPWLTASVSQMPSIDKDGEASLNLTLTGNDNMVVDGTYESYVLLKPEHGTDIVVPVKVTVVSSALTSLTVDVVDAYTLGVEEGEGPHVSGATVRITNSLTSEVVMTGTTGEDGLFSTDILKEGTYYIYVTAPNHYYTEKTITVNPGEENTLQVFLNYKAVNMDYTVERTTVEDEYTVVLTMDVVPDIPQAIVVPNIPGNWGCGKNTYSIRLTNKGRLTALNPYMEFPTIDGYSFTVKSEYPSVLYPNESYDVTVEYEGPEDKRESMIGGLRMYYSYQLKGNTYQSSETYAIVVGCDDGIPMILGGGGLSDDNGSKNLGDNDENNNLDLSITEDQDEKGDTSMPTINVRDYTQTNHNSITLQFEQRFFLTREAFRGSLTIDNQQMQSIENISFVPTVQTIDGKDATDLFAVSTSVNEAEDSSERWDIAAGAIGTATALYVPAKEAAPTEAVDYLFGGTVTYRDVETGQLVTVELMKTRLSVNPSPDLHLTYFVQRDFLGDDILTEEVEPWEPAQFALLIQNKGAGPALDLKVETSEPTIVSNENNLPVEFTSLYTTLDGVEGSFPFTKLNLGRIEAGQNKLARWWFYSNVNAHVANYEVHMTKASNYGEEFNLITVDGVRELVHSVTGSVNAHPAGVKERKMARQTVNPQTNIFLLNQIEDEENLPDYVIDENGNGTDDLEIVSNSSTLAQGSVDDEYVLTVGTTRAGWVYGVVHDPTNCSMVLKKAVRESDGADMTANFWQTERTVTADYSTIVDNRLHWADNIEPEERYILTYEPKPAAAPKVAQLELVTDDSGDAPVVTSVRITFAEPIDATTLGPEDVVMMNHGNRQTVSVSMVDETTAIVDLSSANTVGNNTLTVFTSGIQNKDGVAGSTSLSTEWQRSPLRGDVNEDGLVDISDVVATVSHILGDTPSVFNRVAADVNEDNIIDISDVVGIVNIILDNQ